MDKQIKYLVGVLILVLTAAFFLSLLGELPQYFEDDIIAFLEEEFSGEISFSSVSIWPLNRIRLKSFSYQDQQGNKFAVDELKIDYSFNFSDLNKLVELKFVEAEAAELVIREEIFSQAEAAFVSENNSKSKNPEAAVQAAADAVDFNLPPFMADLKVNLINSSLHLKNELLELEFNNLNLGLKAEAEEEYRLSITTALAAEKIAYDNFKLSNFSSNKLNFELIKNKAETELYLEANNLDVKNFLTFLEEKEYNFNNFILDLNSLQGDFGARAELKLKDSRLKNYQAEVDLSGLNLISYYSRNGKSEDFELEFADFVLAASGPELEISAVKNDVLIDNNLLQLDFKVEGQKSDYSYQAKISAADFDYDYQIFKDQLSQGQFNFIIRLAGKNSRLKRLQTELEAESLKSKYGEFKDSAFKVSFSNKEIFLESAELKLKNGSELALKADYNLRDGSYQLEAAAENFLISQNIFSLLEKRKLLTKLPAKITNISRSLEAERINFSLQTAGSYKSSRPLAAAGRLELGSQSDSSQKAFKAAADFWLAEQVLYLESFNLDSEFSYLDLMGEIDFAKEQLNLRYAAKDFELSYLNQLLQLEFKLLAEINPSFKYLEGQLGGSFANPSLSLGAEIKEIRYQDYLLENINFDAVFKDDKLKIRELKAEIKDGLLRAEGEIKNIASEFLMDLNLKSENLYFQDLAAASNQKLPLSGEIELKAALQGSLKDYELNFAYNSDNLVFNYQGQEFDISNLTAAVEKEGEQFKIRTLSFEHRNLAFKASGAYNLQKGFDLQYSLTGIEPRSYLLDYPQFAADFNGTISLNGELKGLFDNLVLDLRVESKGLRYDGFKIEIKENKAEFRLQEMKLKLNKFNFDFAGGEYQLKGEVFDFTETLKSRFELSLLKTPTAEILKKYLGIYPFAEEIILTGDFNAETEGSSYSIKVDLAAETADSAAEILVLEGEVGREFFIDFEGEKIPVKFSKDQYGVNFKLLSDLDLSGNLRGSFESPILNLKHNFYNLKINNTALKFVGGDLLLERGRRFSTSETIEFIEGGKLNLNGSYSLIEDELSFNAKLASLPLDLLLSFASEKLSSDAVINGDFRAEGALSSPDLSGILKLAGSRLDLGLWDPIKDFSAEIKLADKQAVIKKTEGRFGDGSFNLTGDFNLFAADKFWDLSLSGRELYFDYGSLTGNFDPELKFSGPLQAPLLKGEIELYDFLVKIPFEWPAAKDKNEKKKAERSASKSGLMPRIDLKLIPEDNVRVKNANIDILIEEGDLSLDFNQRRQNSLMMAGELSSQMGRFNYYNSRFNLNNAEAVFTPVDERDIPSLQVNATTYAGGREINVNLIGPADSMSISFSSSPEMTEEEILNLLSSRGALGSAIVGGQDIGVQQIIFQELLRITNSFLQQDLISDLESDFRTALSLDRIEIDALQYGLNREFAIYLGKNLNKRFYLGYAAFFGEEARDNEVTFQYRLTEITNLKGSYIGDGEYEITVETEIDF